MGIKSMIQMYRLLLSKPDIRHKYRQVRPSVVRTLVLVLVVEAIAVAEVYPLRYIFDGMQAGVAASALIGWVVLMFVMRMVHTLFDENKEYHQMYSDWFNLGMLLGHGHEHLLKQDQAFHTEVSTGEKESILSKNVWKMENLIDVVIYQITPMIAMIGFILAGLMLIDWRYTALAIGTIAAYCVVTRHFEKQFTPKRQASHKQWKAIERSGSEQTKGWKVIKSNGLETHMSRRYQQMIDTFVHEDAERRRVRVWHWVVQNSVLNVSLLGMWAFTLWLYSSGSMSPGVMVLINAWMAKLYAHMYRYANFQREAHEGIEGLGEMVKLLESQSTIDDTGELFQFDPRGEACEITIDNVSFYYPGSDRPAICGVTAKITAGSTVAIVAPSGGGKSTMVDLLTRAFDPVEGTIYIDDVPLSSIDRRHYLQYVASVVNQDSSLFDGTIADNIRFGCTWEVSDEEVQTAAKQAFAHKFIMEFDLGYNTLVGEDGVRLSGGQKQRIAIARALVKQSRILIMDESTSSLDEPSQNMIKQAIAHKSAERSCTIVLIAHRFSTIEHADMVIVLDHGRLIDVGTIPELESRCELFRQLRSGEISME